MAKPSKKQEVGLTRKQASMSRRDQMMRTRLLIGIGVASVIILGLIVAGALYEFVIKPSSAIAVVDGVKITTAQYQKMVRYQRNNYANYLRNLQTEKARLDPQDQANSFMIQYYDQMIAQIQSQLLSLDQAVLEQMIEDQLIRKGAQAEGITVTPSEVDEEIESLFGYQRNPPTPAPTPTPAQEGTPAPTLVPQPTPPLMTKEDFDKRFAQFLQEIKRTSGFTEADYRDLVLGQLYRDKLQEVIAARVPATAEQVEASHILVADEATAQTVLERLKNGEDFAALAKEFSLDESNKEQGGELGWFGRGQMVKEFEDAAFALPVGEISQPISTTYGYHIIKVTAHEMDRALDPGTLNQAKYDAFSQWLEDARAGANIQRYWSPDKVPPTATPVYSLPSR